MYHIGAPVAVPAVPLLIRPPDGGLGEAVEDGSSVCTPVTHVGDLDEIPGSWLLSGPALAIVTICGVNQHMESLSLSLSLNP